MSLYDSMKLLDNCGHFFSSVTSEMYPGLPICHYSSHRCSGDPSQTTRKKKKKKTIGGQEAWRFASVIAYMKTSRTLALSGHVQTCHFEKQRHQIWCNLPNHVNIHPKNQPHFVTFASDLNLGRWFCHQALLKNMMLARQIGSFPRAPPWRSS